jgi:hypothetical protein
VTPIRVAVIYVLTPEFEQIVAGTIRIVDGRLVGEPPDDPSVQFILGRTAVRHDTGELVSPDGDPEAFLAALPAAYTGTLLRVGLE